MMRLLRIIWGESFVCVCCFFAFDILCYSELYIICTDNAFLLE